MAQAFRGMPARSQQLSGVCQALLFEEQSVAAMGCSDGSTNLADETGSGLKPSGSTASGARTASQVPEARDTARGQNDGSEPSPPQPADWT